MTGAPSPHIAIVGSGPSGCYLAQSLLRSLPDAQIVIFDRLASPYGLIRYGVAADHQHTKAITRQFERLFQTPNVRFAGNVELGRDVNLEDLREHFNAVVVATGLSGDHALGIPGDNLPGIIGAGTLTRALNAHPDEHETLPELGDDVVIVGAGNVALDLLRFLVKDREHHDASDIAEPLLEQYAAAPAKRITLVSRSAAALSKGDPQMLRELAALPRARYRLHDTSVPVAESAPGQELDRTDTARIAAIEQLLTEDRPAFEGPEVTLCFGFSPLRVVGNTRVEGIEFSSGATVALMPASAILTAIGFAPTGALAELITPAAASAEIGRIKPGLYRTGWAKRGPRGAIPENRACAKSVAEEITADITLGKLSVSASTLGFEGLPTDLQERAVSYEQWLTLEAHEREFAPANRVRQKISDHDRMVAIARGQS
ncbi:FAD-dependent oxidoreductase [Leucobacter coleopterorum]|uniref:ferredoxin--NADP(+) reductase n=1 Tax=Leucobacter coleopterorum TaxID=2714933 RepID=A0ABX6JVA1_9MICO|nr:FAD-dependent oxidoreductase [Leucobacter coleopterorum]QIM18234.1 FAD-dependent oxidoreductase [Leucobacter coleopterorum]